MFNCQTFSLTEGNKKGAAEWEETVWRNASKWLTHAWTITEDMEKRSLFGYAACMHLEECAANWHECIGFVDKYCKYQDC